jgi:hypothetical protein
VASILAACKRFLPEEGARDGAGENGGLHENGDPRAVFR